MAESDPARPAPEHTDETPEQPHRDVSSTGEQPVAHRTETGADRPASRTTGGEAHPVASPTEAQPVLAPAEDSHPAAPKRKGNRLVGTAWVLLAAGLFQVVYFGLLALLIVLLGGAQAVGTQLAQYLTTPFAWLPVLFFFLLFELTVLIFNRAGRFLYVVASLIVGLLVYVLSVLLITVLLRGTPDTATLQQAFLSPLFVLTGLAAREVMLWTGVAIGARGSRVRRRNREARDAYRAELAEG